MAVGFVLIIVFFLLRGFVGIQEPGHWFEYGGEYETTVNTTVTDGQSTFPSLVTVARVCSAGGEDDSGSCSYRIRKAVLSNGTVAEFDDCEFNPSDKSKKTSIECIQTNSGDETIFRKIDISFYR